MSNQQIVDYIKKCKAIDQTDEQIKLALKQAGWQDADIAESFSSLITSSPTQNYGGNFVTAESKSSKKLITVIIIVVLILLAGGASAYYFGGLFKTQTEELLKVVNNNQQQEQQQAAPSPTQQTVNSQPQPQLTAKEAFLKMRVEFDKITNFDELLTFYQKYGSSKGLAYLNSKKAQVDAMPDQLKNSIVSMMKGLSPTTDRLKIVSEEKSGDTVILHLATDNPKEIGTATMVLENGEWKLDNETWKS